MDIFDILILLGLLAVVITLGLGFYALRVGGEFGRKYSNKLMRLRVVFQFITVAILVLAFYVHLHQH
jgi:hypothetical protein